MVTVLNFCLKEFIFGLHADSIVLVGFLHALESIEGRFISEPDAFKQCLVSFVTIMVLLTHPGMYFGLVCLV